MDRVKGVSLKVLKCQRQAIIVPGVGDLNSWWSGAGGDTFLYDLTAVLCPSGAALCPLVGTVMCRFCNISKQKSQKCYNGKLLVLPLLYFQESH